MKEFTVAMALTDYLPVVLFAVAAILLQRDYYHRMSKGAFALFAAGTIDVILAGALKATYKLLYALGICDFAPLSDMFFPVQSIGFMLAGLGMIAVLCHKQGTVVSAVAAPVLWKGTILFVIFMVLGVGLMTGSLAVQAGREKKKAAGILFIVAFVGCLAMGYLSSRDFTGAAMNWIAQGVNIVAQGSLLAGVLLLRRKSSEAAP